MTLRGLLCVIIELVLLLFGLGTGYPALLMAAFSLGLVLALALLSLLLVMLTTRSSGELSTYEVSREDTLTYTVVVKGPVILPVAAYLTILPAGVEKTEKSQRQRHAYLLMPSFRFTRRVSLTLSCPHQGYWKAGPRSIRYEDLFGLFRVQLVGGAKQRLRRHLTVLPHIYPLDSGNNATASAVGFANSQLRSSNSGELLGDARLYQPGDPLKRIHWKLTARTQEIHTRQFELQENSQVLLLLDMQCRSTKRRRTADISVETALSLLQYFCDNNMAVRLLPLRADTGSPLSERRIVAPGEVLETRDLLLSQLYSTVNLPLEVWQLQDTNFASAGTVLVITDNPSPQLLNDLGSLEATGRQVACFSPCLDGDPADMPATIQPVWLREATEIAEKVGACV